MMVTSLTINYVALTELNKEKSFCCYLIMIVTQLQMPAIRILVDHDIIE